MSTHYKIWLNYLNRKKSIYLLGVISIIVCNICQVFYSRAMGDVVDFLTHKTMPAWTIDSFIYGSDLKHKFFFIFSAVALSRIMLYFGRVGWRIFLGRQTHHAGGFLKDDIWQNAQYFSMDTLVNKYPKGILMSAANSDVGQARFVFGFTIVGIADVLFLGLFTIISLFLINVKITIISFLALLIVPIFVRYISSMEMKRYDVAQDYLSYFNDETSKAISTVRLQKLGNTASFWFKRLYAGAQKYRKMRLLANHTSMLYIPSSGSASMATYIILFTYGITLLMDGTITVGEFVAIQGLVYLLQDPLAELGYIISDWRKSFTSLKRLAEIYTHLKEDYLLAEKEGEEISGEEVFSIKNLNFSYEKNTPILTDINLEVRKGMRIGIIGQIGTGKTTLLNILSGLERDFSGQVYFFGKPFKEYSHKFLRSHITMVHQKSFLFADSIRNNILMDQDLSDEILWEVLEVAGLKNDVENFDDGLDTQLGEWGVNLSGGQKQRLTLARGLVRKPEILLLDDCLSAVDTVTEEKILSNIDKFLPNSTLVWVAHRESTLKYCEKVINLDREVSDE
ncbi:ABC transporter ATP-binding protein [Halobacteriovorax sp. DPLXC-1]|uniref:ABC transporter ATP-binding protein n=1 Tax=Halobacteriovorax sp. DPLXC-1 TaxID=3110771 RepID=UPI002FEF956F